MKRVLLPRRVLFLVSVIVAIVLLGAGVAMRSQGVSASARSTSSEHTFTVITFKKDIHFTAIDLPPAGLSPGDERVGWSVLDNKQGTQRVGRIDFFESVTDTAVNQTSTIALKIMYTSSFSNGSIQVVGISFRPSITSPPVNDVYAITGGTGSYEHASGQVHATTQGTVTMTTFSFTQ
jgi:hypothetical protein